MSQNAALRRSIVLKHRPDGAPRREDFEIREDAVPQPAAGEVVTRTIWLSIDPYMRGRLREQQTYAQPVNPGDVMTGETVGEVIASAHADFAPGDVAVGARGWQTHSVTPGERLVKLAAAWRAAVDLSRRARHAGCDRLSRRQRDLPAEEGRDGGDLRRLRRGGLGGRTARQAAGARVVGVAGGAEKCLWVQDSLGFDDCVDHRSLDLRAELAAACPNGIDAYFENVGGAVQAAVFDLLNPFARVAMCGMVSQYNEAEFPPGPNLGFVVGKRVTDPGLHRLRQAGEAGGVAQASPRPGSPMAA